MNNKSRILSASTTLVVMGIFVLMLFINSCSGPSSCDGERCKKALDLDPKIKSSSRDSIFKAENPLTAKKFKVFVESSSSMDGYVLGNTTFKTVLHRIISQVVADVLKDDKSFSMNYINSDIIPQNTAPDEFVEHLSPKSFKDAGGDRANSKITEVISKVIGQTPARNLSMLVSDCVYSPESSEDIDQALEKQQADMLNILKNKYKHDKKISVLLYRLMSDFHGVYYTKTNAPIQCDGERPYFVWFFGDESILANVSESISKIMTAKKAQYIAGIPPYSYLPYKTIKSDHAYHYLSAKARADSLFTFSFVADMSYLPLSKEYIMDINNYHCSKDKYYIKKIEEYSNEGKANYNYRYTVCIHGRKNSFVTPTLVEISLKSMLTSMPVWINKYDDPKGTDYDNGYKPDKLRTFGLKSLAEGLKDFYKSDYYFTFKIQIN